jgi:hypothetical protein
MTTCCAGYDETPRHPLAAPLSHLFRVACAGLVARGAAFRAYLRGRQNARQTSDALRWLRNDELREIGITRPTWWMLNHQSQGFGAQLREAEKRRSP